MELNLDKFACPYLSLEQDLTSHGTKKKGSVHRFMLASDTAFVLQEEEMSELVVLSLSKSILRNPEVVGPHSKELASWRLLLKTGARPLVQRSLATKVCNCLLYTEIVSHCDSRDNYLPARS